MDGYGLPWRVLAWQCTIGGPAQAGGPGAPGAPAPGGGFGYGNIYLSFPWFNSNCGDIDLIGETKPQGYYRRVVWGTSKLEMVVQRPVPAGRTEVISGWGWSDELRSWTWPGYEGRTVAVRVASTGDQVRLLLNGKEVGTKPVSRATEYKAEFQVPYAAGELKAIAMQGGQPIAEQSSDNRGKADKDPPRCRSVERSARPQRFVLRESRNRRRQREPGS